MRASLTTVLFAILLATTAWSQPANSFRHPVDPNAEFLGAMTVDLSPQSQVQRERSLLEQKLTVATTITVFRSEGRVDYNVILDSIRFIGDGAWVDGTSTAMIFNMIGRLAVTQGMAMGYTSCPTSCGTNATTRVYVEACVQRFGSGSGTYFTACSPSAYCMREYTVCCPNGPETPLIELVRSESQPCTQVGVIPACESTCPQ